MATVEFSPSYIIERLHRRKREEQTPFEDLYSFITKLQQQLLDLHQAIVTGAPVPAVTGSAILTKERIQKYEERIGELEQQLQMHKDEHQALQLAFTSLEKKHLDLVKEHQALVNRWMESKKDAAEKLNAENERIQERQREMMRRQIEGAINEMNDIQRAKIAAGDSDMIAAAAAAAAASNILQDDLPEPSMVASCIPSHHEFCFDAHDGEVDAVNWFVRGNCPEDLVATGGGDRKVNVWKLSDSVATKQMTLLGSNAGITSIDIDNDCLLASSNDFASRIWSLTDQKLRRTLTGHSNKVLAAKFLGTPNTIVSGSHDRTLKIWDISRNACSRTLFVGSSCNDLVCFNQSSPLVISGHFDKRIKFWDARSENCGHEIQLQGKITSLDISPDNTTLLCSIRDDTIKTLDLRNNQVIRTYSADSFKIPCDYTRAKFSTDGLYIVCGSNDGSTFVWNVATSKVETVLRKPQNAAIVMACTWSPNGKKLITVDRSKKVFVWT